MVAEFAILSSLTSQVRQTASSDADTAKALAEFKGSTLSLTGLNTLDANTAKALAELVGKAE